MSDRRKYLPLPADDKELRGLVARMAMECPCCERPVVLHIYGTPSDRNRAAEVLVPFQMEGKMFLVQVEETEELEREKRDKKGGGGESVHPAAFRK